MERRQGPVVVGVDGSPQSLRALRWAAEEARRWEAPLTLVWAWEPSLVHELASAAGPGDEAGVERAARGAADGLDRVVADAAATLDGLAVERRVVRGRPVSVLLQESEDAAMLVVGARGQGGFEKLLLGSVSEQCVHHATGPVVVVR
jgi:nucleotide-binding universal stress UspA family protein